MKLILQIFLIACAMMAIHAFPTVDYPGAIEKVDQFAEILTQYEVMLNHYIANENPTLVQLIHAKMSTAHENALSLFEEMKFFMRAERLTFDEGKIFIGKLANTFQSFQESITSELEELSNQEVERNVHSVFYTLKLQGFGLSLETLKNLCEDMSKCDL